MRYLAQGMESQTVVCQMVGRATRSSGGLPTDAPSGNRPAYDPLALGRGEHVLTCATIAGITSSVRIKIQ